MRAVKYGDTGKNEIADIAGRKVTKMNWGLTVNVMQRLCSKDQRNDSFDKG